MLVCFVSTSNLKCPSTKTRRGIVTGTKRIREKSTEGLDDLTSIPIFDGERVTEVMKTHRNCVTTSTCRKCVTQVKNQDNVCVCVLK